MGPRWGSTPKQTGRMTVSSRKCDFELKLVECWVRCEIVASLQGTSTEAEEYPQMGAAMAVDLYQTEKECTAVVRGLVTAPFRFVVTCYRVQ
jgi:hypothetical protein